MIGGEVEVEKKIEENELKIENDFKIEEK